MKYLNIIIQYTNSMDDSLKKSFEDLESSENINELSKNIGKLFLYVIELQ